MKTATKLVSIGLFIILTFSLIAYSGQTTGAAEGFIYDAQSGEPVSKARITLVFAKSESIKFHLSSDNKGHFYRGGLTPGFYNVNVEKDGYLPMSGSIRVRLGRTEKVEIRLETFESLAPESTRFSDQGSKLLKEGKYEEAIDRFTKAISEDSSNPVYYYYRGASFERNGNMEKALEDYQKSIELKPEFILPISRTARIHAKQKDFEKAIEFYKKAIELGDQDATTYYNYGACLRNLGNSGEAKNIFEQLIVLDENYSDAYYQLGIIYIGLGEGEKAKEFLQKFIDMDPENPNASIAREIIKSLKLPRAVLF